MFIISTWSTGKDLFNINLSNNTPWTDRTCFQTNLLTVSATYWLREAPWVHDKNNSTNKAFKVSFVVPGKQQTQYKIACIGTVREDGSDLQKLQKYKRTCFRIDTVAAEFWNPEVSARQLWINEKEKNTQKTILLLHENKNNNNQQHRKKLVSETGALGINKIKNNRNVIIKDNEIYVCIYIPIS